MGRDGAPAVTVNGRADGPPRPAPWPAPASEPVARRDEPIAAGLRHDGDALLRLLDLLAPVAPDATRPARRYAVLPRAEAPRYLLPLDARRATRGVILRPGNGGTAKQVVLRAALATALRTGALPLLGREVHVPDGRPGTPSLLQWLEHELDDEHLVMSLAIGPPRPNRKPVLQLLTGDGRTVAFAKMAVDEDTGRLVRNEHEFLSRHRPQVIVVPEALGRRQWKGADIALYAPLALGPGVDGGSRLRLTSAMVLDIARLLPVDRVAVTSSGWWTAVEERAALAAGERGDRLRSAVRRTHTRLDAADWTFGAWHGDLTTWNAVEVDGRLHVWDWERAGGPVPIGFDAVHGRCQLSTLRDGETIAVAARRATTDEGALLAAVGVPPDEHDLLVDCYLLEWCLRLFDGARNGPLGELDRTIPELLEHLLRSDR